MFITNHDRDSSMTLTSTTGTKLRIWGDPHVQATVNGKTRTYNIGYGDGKVTLKDGTRVSWDTWGNSSHALLNFSVDKPGARRTHVNTADGADVNHQLTALTDAQLKELIGEMGHFSDGINGWGQRLHRH